MDILSFFAEHPALNFLFYLNFCIVVWGLSLWIYEKSTPCREWRLIMEGNKAAAFSMGGAAIGMAIPLASLVTHSQGWSELAKWSVLSLACQLGLWFIMSRSAFPKMKECIEGGKESVGMFVGSCSVALGVMVGACVT